MAAKSKAKEKTYFGETNMRGIVLHSRGHFRRCLEGRTNEYQLSVQALSPAPELGGSKSKSPTRPAYYIFSCAGKAFASSERVVVTKGRRYPSVEHWFILPAAGAPTRARPLDLSPLLIY